MDDDAQMPRAIRVQVACDDPSYRETIDRILAQHDDVAVVEKGCEDERGAQDLESVKPDVTIVAVPPGRNVASHARIYVEAAAGSTGLVGFCTLDSQAQDYRRAGITTLVRSTDPPDALHRAVAKAARNGQ